MKFKYKLLRGSLHAWRNQTSEISFTITSKFYLTGNDKIIGCPLNSEIRNIDVLDNLIQVVSKLEMDMKKFDISFFSCNTVQTEVLPWLKTTLIVLKTYVIESICNKKSVDLNKELNIIQLALSNFNDKEAYLVKIINENLDSIKEVNLEKMQLHC